MAEYKPLPPNLYAVVRFMGRIGGIFPSLEAASRYRDRSCTSADIYAVRVSDDGRGLILGAKLA